AARGGEVGEDRAALDRRGAPPGREGGPRCRDRAVDVGRVAACPLADLPAGRGIVHVEVTSAPRRHVLAPDEVIPALVHHVRPVSRARSSTASKMRTAAASTRTPPAPAAPAPPCSAAWSASHLR